MYNSIQALYDSYPQEQKNDFFYAFMYMKYKDHFFHHAMTVSGLPTRKLNGALDPALDKVLQLMVKESADAAMSHDTSIEHGKIVKTSDAIQLVNQTEDVSLITPEQVVPYKLAKDLILRNPRTVAIGECACRGTALNPCSPKDVCIFIGDPYVSFVLEHNPKFKQVSQEEAAEIIEAEHERGHIHCAYFKKEMAGSFFCLCNCCNCCCLGVRNWNILGGMIPLLTSSGYIARIGDQCNGCGDCVTKCPFSAIDMDEESQRAMVNTDKCMGCGVCEGICSIGAFSLKREISKGDPLDLEALINGKTS